MSRIFGYKARSARNSGAISKLCNAVAGYSGRKMPSHDLFRGSLGRNGQKFRFVSTVDALDSPENRPDTAGSDRFVIDPDNGNQFAS